MFWLPIIAVLIIILIFLGITKDTFMGGLGGDSYNFSQNGVVARPPYSALIWPYWYPPNLFIPNLSGSGSRRYLANKYGSRFNWWPYQNLDYTGELFFR
jgi:hypothetical protein